MIVYWFFQLKSFDFHDDLIVECSNNYISDLNWNIWKKSFRFRVLNLPSLMALPVLISDRAALAAIAALAVNKLKR